MVKVTKKNKDLLERIEVEPMSEATKKRLAKAAEKMKDKACFEEQTKQAKKLLKTLNFKGLVQLNCNKSTKFNFKRQAYFI